MKTEKTMQYQLLNSQLCASYGALSYSNTIPGVGCNVGLFHKEKEADPGRTRTRKPRITKTRLFQKPLTDLFIRRTN